MEQELKFNQKQAAFKKLLFGEPLRVSPLGGYIPYDYDMEDDSYYLKAEEFRKSSIGSTAEGEL